MESHDLPGVDLVLYHKGIPVGVFQPDYLGMLGVHLDNCQLNFDNGTALEIEILGPDKTCVDDKRIPVLVSVNTKGRLGLTIKHVDKFAIDRWRQILKDVFSSAGYKKYYSDDSCYA